MREEKYYLVEDQKVVNNEDGVTVFDVYVKEIGIDNLKRIFIESGFKETKKFNDWYVFESPSLEFDVVLKSEDDYYDLKDQIKSKEEFTNLVEMFSFSLKDSLSSVDVKVLNKIMDNFDLSIYDMEKQRHYSNALEIK